ncbi:MAG: DOMON-like domain-containing protein [Pseudomonadales bacterium]
MNFVLQPFTPNPAIPNLQGEVIREQSTLTLTFQKTDLPNVIWPNRELITGRRDNLWQSTCFECFVGLKHSSRYLEINAAPSGHWQSYEFTDYRQRQGISAGTTARIVTESRQQSTQTIHVEVDITDPQFVTADWQISVSVVLAQVTRLDYYALDHPQQQPDFHLPELRRLDLPGNELSR